MFGKRSVTFLLVLSIVSATFYLPVFAPKTQAFLGFGDISFDVPTIVRFMEERIAMPLAQAMIDNMVKSTIDWAQNGFDGNPAYAINPKQYFTDISDGIAGDFIAGSDLNFLCSPFKTQIKLALTQEHYTQLNQFQCTLTQVVGNIDAFYNDFSQGGWDGWFAMTQNSANNPYGAYLDAKVEMDSRIARAIGLKSQQLDWNQGFLSYEKCDGKELDDQINPGKKICDGNINIVTPGSIIQSQLNEVIPSGLKKLEVAQHIDQLISSFATGLLNRYVFGSRGLFAGRSSSGGTGSNVTSRTGNIDVDVPTDGIPDGMDLDYDGKLESSTDICHHGGKPGIPPTSTGCVKSSTITTSPYFTPICQALDKAVIVLKDFTTFIDTYADQMKGGAGLSGTIIPPILAAPPGTPFGTPNSGGVDNFVNKADAEIWWSRHNEVESVVGEILSNIRSRSSTYFDNIEIATNRYYNYTGKVSESLIKDQDLDLARKGNGGGGLENLMKHSAYNLRYFREVKKEIGKCENPDIGTIGGIPLPPIVTPPGGGGGEGTPIICKVPDGKYAGDLRAAMDAVLTDNPEDIANQPNIEAGGRVAGRKFLGFVEIKLRSMGFLATTEVRNGNGNANTGDLIAVWKTEDTKMERYDAIVGEDKNVKPIKNSTQTIFTGLISKNCTDSGGGSKSDCKCEEAEPTAGGGSGTTSGGGDTCQEKGQTDLYQGDVKNAAREALASLEIIHPGIGNLDNYTSEKEVGQLRDKTIAILKTRGFEASTSIGPDGKPYPQMIMIWKSNDPDKHGYRVTASNNTIKIALEQGYCGGHETLAGGDIIPNILACMNPGGGVPTVATYPTPSNPTYPTPSSPSYPTPTNGSPVMTSLAQVNLGVGTFPDITFFNKRIYLAVQQSGQLFLYNWATDLTDQKIQQIPYTGGQAFPRLTVSNNILWLAFRGGNASVGSAETARLWRSDTGAIEDLSGGMGNDPVAVENGFVAWQKLQADGKIWKVVRRALTGTTITVVRDALPTGISRILSNGTIKMIDEDRTAVSGYTRPWIAGDLTIAEGKTSGVFGFLNNPSSPFSITNSTFTVFDGQESFAPHAATNGTLHAVATWGNVGVRIIVGKKVA